MHTLLIHGGAHGAWCWQAVIDGLAARGSRASAFDLPGCGSDPTARAGLTLDDSVAAVLAQIDALPRGPVRVVGHSIAGWLLPYAAAARTQVAEVVFLAAIPLRRGEHGIDMIPASRRPTYFEMARSSADNTILGEFEPTWERFFASLPEQRARALYDRLTPQPFGPYLAPAEVGVDELTVPRRYLAATRERNFSAETVARFADKVGVAPEPVVGDHCVMLTDPQELVSALATEPSPRPGG